jgi:hypothetical protein
MDFSKFRKHGKIEDLQGRAGKKTKRTGRQSWAEG